MNSMLKPARPPADPHAALKFRIKVEVQKRLDAFALTHDFASILSAVSYADSSVSAYAADGKAARDQRDATWLVLDAYMAEVVAGTKPVPKDYAEVAPSLPVLAWPVTAPATPTPTPKP